MHGVGKASLRFGCLISDLSVKFLLEEGNEFDKEMHLDLSTRKLWVVEELSGRSRGETVWFDALSNC